MCSHARAIRWNANDGQSVNLPEFRRRFPGGASHAGEAMETAKESLKTHARDGFARIGGLKAFLRFDGLVQTFAPGSLRHRATGKFIDDDHLAVGDDILAVFFEKFAGDEGGPDNFSAPF